LIKSTAPVFEQIKQRRAWLFGLENDQVELDLPQVSAEIPAFGEHRLREQLVVVLDDAVEREEQVFVRRRGVDMRIEVREVGGDSSA
jgi:hypothetical protein